MSDRLEIIYSINGNFIIKGKGESFENYNEIFTNNGGCWIKQIESWIFPNKCKDRISRIINGINKSHDLLNKKMDSVLGSDSETSSDSDSESDSESDFESEAKEILKLVNDKEFKNKIFDYEKIVIPQEILDDSSENSNSEIELPYHEPKDDSKYVRGRAISQKISNLEDKLNILIKKLN